MEFKPFLCKSFFLFFSKIYLDKNVIKCRILVFLLIHTLSHQNDQKKPNRFLKKEKNFLIWKIFMYIVFNFSN